MYKYKVLAFAAFVVAGEIVYVVGGCFVVPNILHKCRSLQLNTHTCPCCIWIYIYIYICNYRVNGGVVCVEIGIILRLVLSGMAYIHMCV